MGILSAIGKGFKTLFSDDPNQYVEDENGANLTTVSAVAIKDGNLSKEDAANLIRAQRESIKMAETSNAKVEAEIKILPSDKSDFREDDTINRIQATNVTVKPAGELENHERQPGGRERESIQK